MKKVLSVTIGVFMVLAFAACGNKGNANVEETTSQVETTKEKVTQTTTIKEETTTEEQKTEETEVLEEPEYDEVEIENEGEEENMNAENEVKIEMSVKDYGKINLVLYKDVAPITVENFVKLTNKKFYDGLTFHRIISGFMIQGGDPEGTGMGGSDEEIKGEFQSNGVENNLSHTRGVISMARANDPNSASSQFFIVHEDSEFLDGNYAAFGEVTDGMDVVDKICDTVRPIDGNGTVKKPEQPVIEYIKVVE